MNGIYVTMNMAIQLEEHASSRVTASLHANVLTDGKEMGDVTNVSKTILAQIIQFVLTRIHSATLIHSTNVIGNWICSINN